MNFWGYNTDERFIGAVKFGKDVEVTDPCYTPDLGCGYTAHDFEPEKPVTIPANRYILLPDESYKYNVGRVYGMCADAWKEAA